MRVSRTAATLVISGACLVRVLAQAPQQAPAPAAPVEATGSAVLQLTGKTLRVYEVPEANQGVAAGLAHFFAVDNSALAKYEIKSGRLADRWAGAPNGPIRHMNSCLVDAGRIRCANSNYPQTPMGSSIEVFDPVSLDHVSSYSLGMRDEGSLTWFDRYRTGWIAAFSHYDKNGGVPFKDHSFSSVVTFDEQWRRTGGWLLPESALERMAPYASSGGAIGPDGWLYLLGHDRPELYVVGRPTMGPVLVHVATIAIESEGQAFSWAKNGARVIYTIDRRKHLVRTIEIPPVVVKDAPVPVSLGVGGRRSARLLSSGLADCRSPTADRRHQGFFIQFTATAIGALGLSIAVLRRNRPSRATAVLRLVAEDVGAGREIGLEQRHRRLDDRRRAVQGNAHRRHPAVGRDVEDFLCHRATSAPGCRRLSIL